MCMCSTSASKPNKQLKKYQTKNYILSRISSSMVVKKKYRYVEVENGGGKQIRFNFKGTQNLRECRSMTQNITAHSYP